MGSGCPRRNIRPGRDDPGLTRDQLLGAPVTATCQDCRFLSHRAPSKAPWSESSSRGHGSCSIPWGLGQRTRMHPFPGLWAQRCRCAECGRIRRSGDKTNCRGHHLQPRYLSVTARFHRHPVVGQSYFPTVRGRSLPSMAGLAASPGTVIDLGGGDGSTTASRVVGFSSASSHSTDALTAGRALASKA